MNKLIAWWQSIWANVKPPTEAIPGEAKSNLAPDITIAKGTIPTGGSATTLTNTNGDVELK